MTISPFIISGIPRILFGDGRLAEVPNLLRSYGEHTLIVTGAKSFQSSPHWTNLLQSMSAQGVLWDVMTIPGEPSPDLVDQAVKLFKDRGVDVVLGIGGGSVIDAAKAIAGLLPFGNSVMDHLEVVGRGIPYQGPPTPCIAVPTTAGTGSEATKNAVLSARGIEGFKRSFRHESLVPDVAVIDPTLANGSPPEITASSGMDALTQLLESYVSTGSNPFTDGLALSGLRMVKEGLLPAYEGGAGEAAGRSAMAYAALISGITLAHAGLGVAHGLASPLGAYFPIPHGVACAAIVGSVAKANIRALRERAPDSPALAKYAKAGAVLSGQSAASREQAWDLLMETLLSLRDRLKIPKLREYGMKKRDLVKIANTCTAKTNPIALTNDELVGILKESL
ncbi:MAG: iron-containing alcohol dehydrogenase [Armatimonadota bacterium]|nr:iron-containing alcohol dehydrogenase [Armatimonadota bacterium]